MRRGRPRTLERLERILIMVPWLLDHPGVPIDEVAERFGGRPDDLARDLDLLGYCGLPGYGGGDLVEVAISGGRVTVRMADYFSRPLSLTMKEAVTLLLAARTLAGVEGLAESAPLRSAIDKVEKALGADARVSVDLSAAGDGHLEAAREAVERRRVVRLVHRSGSTGEVTERLVEPWALLGARGAWYLRGWCRTAAGPRDFRLDRVRELEVTSEACTEPVQEELPTPEYVAGPTDVEVRLELAPGARWFAEWVVADSVTERADGRCEVAFRTPALDWVARSVLRLGPDAEVLEPEALQEAAADLARKALARYGQ